MVAPNEYIYAEASTKFNPAHWTQLLYPTYKERLTVYTNCQNFIPFDYGRRACPEYDFVERTLVIMVARLAWTFNIMTPIDRDIQRPLIFDMEYELVSSLRPLQFPCQIIPRGEDRVDVVMDEAAKVVM